MANIEDNSNQDPTQEEFQKYVNRVYEYAADLILNKGMSYEETTRELVSQGVDEEGANTVVSNLKEQIKEAKNEAANKELGYGALWAIGGAGLTAITGGTFIFYGAVIWGVWLILKGLYHKII